MSLLLSPVYLSVVIVFQAVLSCSFLWVAHHIKALLAIIAERHIHPEQVSNLLRIVNILLCGLGSNKFIVCLKHRGPPPLPLAAVPKLFLISDGIVLL